MTQPDLEAVARAVGKVIPQGAVHRGWNVADLGFDVDETGERWSVKLLGPVEASTQELTYDRFRAQRLQRLAWANLRPDIR